MSAKRFFQKALQKINQSGLPQGSLRPAHLNPRITVHYGIPSTSSLLSFDPLQRILAVATLDGRIKIIGGAGIECLLVSPIQLPYKFLEFLNNQGYLVSITNQNDIQVWDLHGRALACYIQWESNITAFAVIQGTSYMYIGDDLGNVAVVKYSQEEAELSEMPYHIPVHIIQEASKHLDSFPSSVVGVFPQPSVSDSRVLLTYANGLIILWDLYEAQVVAVRGGPSLKFKNNKAASSPSGMGDEASSLDTDDDNEEKEICCSCWASADGSILAVGYTDGDILLWSIPSGSSSKHQHEDIDISSSKIFAKLQLSPSKRRIPVIVLRWCVSGKNTPEGGGQLFVYGGDEIGSPEVLTVLGLEWSYKMEKLACISRLDLEFHGSFADMIMLPTAGSMWSNPSASFLILTNPGNLHAYDGASILESSLRMEEERSPISPLPVPIQAPLVEPCVTVTKLVLLPKNVNASKILSQLPRALKSVAPSNLSSSMKWPVTGGVHGSMSFDNSSIVEIIYISGHENGTVKVWDASVPFLGLLCSVENEVQNLNLNWKNAPISALEFCPISDILAVGDEQGLVRLYKLSAKSGEVSCHVVTEAGKQVHVLHFGNGFQCVAVFVVHQSPIRSFAFTNATRVCVASEDGLVSVIDLLSFSILFSGKCFPGCSTTVISLSMKTITKPKGLLPSPTSPKSGHREKDSTEASLNIVFFLTKDGSLITIDADRGVFLGSKPLHPKHQSTAVAFHLVDISSISDIGWAENGETQETNASSQDGQPDCDKKKIQDDLNEIPVDTFSGTKRQAEGKECFENTSTISGQNLENVLLLLCSEDALRIYSASSFIQGSSRSICKVKLEIPCCWASTFVSKDENVIGLVLLYQNGLLEMRSLPDMKVVGDISLSALLRWKFQLNLLKTISSSANGRIALIHNKEMAYLSLLANENNLRIPASFPSLHDKELAAAADAAIKASFHQIPKKKQIQGFLGGVIKEIKGGVLRHTSSTAEKSPTPNTVSDLSSLFAWCPFPEQTSSEIDIEAEILNIDDIEIEEDFSASTASSSAPASSTGFVYTGKASSKDKASDRQKLLDEKTEELKPRKRTPDEIKAAYGHKKALDVSGVAGLAVNRLQERGEKLQTISKHTEELQEGAENFASMADELLKTMERRKWWQI